MKKLSILLFVFVLSSCMVSLRPHIGKPFTSKNYEFNQELVSNVGEPFIVLRADKKLKGFIAVKDCEVPDIGLGGGVDGGMILKGDKFYVEQEIVDDNSYIIFCPEYYERAENKSYSYINVDKNGNVLKGWVDYGGEAAWIQNGEWCSGLFKPLENGYNKDGKFLVEILYLGKEGSVIKAMYREFYEDFARPSYTQQLQWDMNESKIISYRSLTIEVLEATNSYIKYKVLDDKVLPWMRKK